MPQPITREYRRQNYNIYVIIPLKEVPATCKSLALEINYVEKGGLLVGSRSATVFRRLASFTNILDKLDSSASAPIVAHIIQFERATKEERR